MDAILQTLSTFVISLSVLLFFGPIIVIISLIGNFQIGPMKIDLRRRSKSVRTTLALIGLASWLLLYIPLVMLAFRAIKSNAANVPPEAGSTSAPVQTATVLASITQPSTYSSISSDAFRSSLWDGEMLVSANGQHVLQLKDGVATLYSNNQVVWYTKTAGSNANRLAMQEDGNLVLYADSIYIWDTQTAVTPPAAPYTLEVQDDGNLVIHDSNGDTIWSAK
jgi:hypothetical protein